MKSLTVVARSRFKYRCALWFVQRKKGYQNYQLSAGNGYPLKLNNILAKKGVSSWDALF